MSRFGKYLLAVLIMVVLLWVAVHVVSKHEQLSQHEAVETLRLADMEKNALLYDSFSSLDTLFVNFVALTDCETEMGALSKMPLSLEVLQRYSAAFSQTDSLINADDRILARLHATSVALSSTSFDAATLNGYVARMEAFNDRSDAKADSVKQILAVRSTPLSEEYSALFAGQTLHDNALTPPRRTNKAYYVIDNGVRLLRMGIIRYKYLLFGPKSINEDVRLDRLDSLDMDAVTQIPVGHRGAELVSLHPEGSYRLEFAENGNECSAIVITDPQSFWSQSKVLVVSYSYPLPF